MNETYQDLEGENRKYPKTFKELFKGTGIEPTVDEEGNTHYNFKATRKKDNKYFVPDIFDIRVGYECEIFNHLDARYRWEILDRDFIKNIMDEYDHRLYEIRVPYLTKEQIEAEGWKPYKKSAWIFKKGDNYLDFAPKLDFTNAPMITIHLGEGTNLFDGNCKDINTFRYICKLLNIS